MVLEFLKQYDELSNSSNIGSKLMLSPGFRVWGSQADGGQGRAVQVGDFHRSTNTSCAAKKCPDTSSSPWAANLALHRASWPNLEKAYPVTVDTCIYRSSTNQAITCFTAGPRTLTLRIRTSNTFLIWDVTFWLVFWMAYRMSCPWLRPRSTLTNDLLRISGHL